jgi:hypothetical protein
MPEHVYKLTEVTGSSAKSYHDAIENAIARAAKTIRHIQWFEVVNMRGHVEDGKVAHWQATIKIGFTLED